MSGNEDERVREEIEALEAILMDDVTVEYNEAGVPERVTTVVFPSTADDARQQYVCMTLEVRLVVGYPDREPEVILRNPRGLDDALIADIERSVGRKCAECLSQPVLFELIELVRERLTDSNVPACQCAVCLYGFTHGDQFSKTACYHYFHSHCLARLVAAAERAWAEERDKLPAWQRAHHKDFAPLCPVCREPLGLRGDELAALQQASPPVALDTQRAFEASAELRALQANMAALFLRQQRRGGIIDVAADESKLLVLTTEPEPGPGPAEEPPGGEEEAAAPSSSRQPQPQQPRTRHPRSKHTHTTATTR